MLSSPLFTYVAVLQIRRCCLRSLLLLMPRRVAQLQVLLLVGCWKFIRGKDEHTWPCYKRRVILFLHEKAQWCVVHCFNFPRWRKLRTVCRTRFAYCSCTRGALALFPNASKLDAFLCFFCKPHIAIPDSIGLLPTLGFIRSKAQQ